MRELCKANGIHVSAYSPLGAFNTKWGHNRVLECDVLEDIAKAKGKTTAQVVFNYIIMSTIRLQINNSLHLPKIIKLTTLIEADFFEMAV